MKHQITQVTQPPYSPDLAPCDFWLVPKVKSPLKGRRFQTVDEIQENTTGPLMVTGRTVRGPKVPTMKGTEVSLSYVQCFLYLVSSSINVSFSCYVAGYLLDRSHICLISFPLSCTYYKACINHIPFSSKMFFKAKIDYYWEYEQQVSSR